MEIIKIQDFKLKDIILISSLPDMGKVGGLVTQHLAKKLNSQISSKIILSDKPWVNLKNGIIDLPQEDYIISVDEKNSIVIFTGENQPQEPGTVFEMANTILDTVSKMGNIKMIISTGGYLPSENNKGSEVFGVATKSNLLDTLKSHNVKVLSPEVKSITWFNGVILGIAKTKNIEGLGLFGEIVDVETPQYRAASNIVKIIGEIIQMKIETNELDEKIIEKHTEIKKDGPGIG